jgi:hypothetical protein
MFRQKYFYIITSVPGEAEAAVLRIDLSASQTFPRSAEIKSCEGNLPLPVNKNEAGMSTCVPAIIHCNVGHTYVVQDQVQHVERQ